MIGNDYMASLQLFCANMPRSPDTLCLGSSWLPCHAGQLTSGSNFFPLRNAFGKKSFKRTLSFIPKQWLSIFLRLQAVYTVPPAVTTPPNQNITFVATL